MHSVSISSNLFQNPKPYHNDTLSLCTLSKNYHGQRCRPPRRGRGSGHRRPGPWLSRRSHNQTGRGRRLHRRRGRKASARSVSFLLCFSNATSLFETETALFRLASIAAKRNCTVSTGTVTSGRSEVWEE